MHIDFQISKGGASWLVNQLPAQDIHDIIKELPDAAALFFKGFKVSVRNAERKPVKNRLARELAHNPELVEGIILRPHSPWNKLLQILTAFDESWLIRNWRALTLASDGLIAVAMLVDPRESLQKRAARLFYRSGFWERNANNPFSHLRKRPTPPAWEGLQEFFASLADQDNRMECSEEQVKEFEHTNRHLKNEVEQLKNSLQKQKHQNSELRERERQLAATKDQELKDLKDDLRKTSSQLQDLQKTFEQRVQQEMQKYRREVLGISPDTEHMRQALKESEADGLAARSRKVLAAQRHLNEQYGTKQALRERIEELEALEQELEQSAVESLKVLPEVNELQDQLNEEIERLKSFLPAENRDEAYDYTVRRLLKKARTASPDNNGEQILAGIDELLSKPAFREATDKNSLTKLDKVIRERREYLERLIKERHLADIEPRAPREEQTAPKGVREIWDVKYELSRLPSSQQQVLILVDAYNVIKGSEKLNAIIEQQGLQSARKKFIEMSAHKASDKARIELVFDGVETLSGREKRSGDHLVITFAAHQGESQNADNYIVKRASELILSGTEKPGIWIVTADYGLRSRAVKYSDGFVQPGDFLSYLNSA
ncbi:MAG: NYN domain-containing protein [Verrucomicrobiota bacterium]